MKNVSSHFVGIKILQDSTTKKPQITLHSQILDFVDKLCKIGPNI
jgi:hypothetical protein